jgi:hypothetical protein
MKRSFLFAVCLIVLLAGCGVRQTGQIQEVNVHTGTQGIVAKFLDQNPPPVTYANSATAVSYELDNNGASDVDNGIVSIGVEDDFVALQGDRVRPFTLAGRSLANPGGDTKIESVQLRTKSLPPQTETATTSVALNVCFPYTTDAELTMCVDTDVFGRVKAKSCTAQAIGLSGGQGGPVSVTKVEPSYTPDADTTKVRATYVISVRNIGTGQLYSQDKSIEACTPAALGPDSWNIANIQAFLGDQQLDCTPKSPNGGLDGFLKIIAQNENFVRCELPGGVLKMSGTYTTTMRVEVKYGYTYTLTKQLQIKRLG